MLVAPMDIKPRQVNKIGKHHFKVIAIEEHTTSKGKPITRMICKTKDSREFIQPLYVAGNRPSELLWEIAEAIGYENCMVDEVIDTKLFVGGFFYGFLAEYTGDNHHYISGYHLTSVWESGRRYDRTGSTMFRAVRQRNKDS
jgi:hypothetical protein